MSRPKIHIDATGKHTTIRVGAYVTIVVNSEPEHGGALKALAAAAVERGMFVLGYEAKEGGIRAELSLGGSRQILWFSWSDLLPPSSSWLGGMLDRAKEALMVEAMVVAESPALEWVQRPGSDVWQLYIGDEPVARISRWMSSWLAAQLGAWGRISHACCDQNAAVAQVIEWGSEQTPAIVVPPLPAVEPERIESPVIPDTPSGPVTVDLGQPIESEWHWPSGAPSGCTDQQGCAAVRGCMHQCGAFRGQPEDAGEAAEAMGASAERMVDLLEDAPEPAEDKSPI